MVLQERLVDLFDQRVGSDQFLVELAWDRQRDFGERGSRRRNASGAKGGESKRFMGSRRIHGAGIQVERLQTQELLALLVAIQIELQVAPQLSHRRQVAAAALIAQADIGELLVADLHFPTNPWKLDPEAAALVNVGRLVGLGLRLGLRSAGASRLTKRRELHRGLHGREVLGRDRDVNLPDLLESKNVVASLTLRLVGACE